MTDVVSAALARRALKPPRLIASDLDGTLLNSGGRLSRRTADALTAVQDLGVGLVIATARPPRWMHGLTEIIGDHGVVICSNGAFLYHVPNRTVLAERSLTTAVVKELVAALRAAIPSITFAVESATGFGREPSYVDLQVAPPGIPVRDIAELLDPLPGKLLARAPDLGQEEFLAAVTDVVGDTAIVAYSGAGGLAEISAAGVTKAAVLADWAAERGTGADDVWAFGDMPNDLAMLTWAGTSFAVANAHADVLAATTYTIGSNDDDGVAEIIELLLGEGRQGGSARHQVDGVLDVVDEVQGAGHRAVRREPFEQRPGG
ncbi:MAG: Cof-type HAD-IIB family hydrolase [Nocardioidaceae bacterium]